MRLSASFSELLLKLTYLPLEVTNFALFVFSIPPEAAFDILAVSAFIDASLEFAVG